jgi:hypothetical protein
MEWDTEVSGDKFWEHLSRLLKAGKAFEDEVGDRGTFLLVAVEDLIIMDVHEASHETSGIWLPRSPW